MQVLEYFFLLIFIRQFIHEEQQLWRFIVFQKQVPLDQLDAKRKQYNRTEQAIFAQQKSTIFLLFGAFLIAYIVDLTLLWTSNKEGWFDVIAALLIMFAFIESMLGLFIYTFFYLQAMKWYQNYEYFKHRNRTLGLSVMLVMCLAYLVLVTYFFCFQQACNSWSNHYNITEGSDFCNRLDTFVSNLYRKHPVIPSAD